MTVHITGVIVAIVFMAALAAAGSPSLGILAALAWLGIELLTWSGAFGLGRPDSGTKRS